MGAVCRGGGNPPPLPSPPQVGLALVWATATRAGFFNKLQVCTKGHPLQVIVVPGDCVSAVNTVTAHRLHMHPCMTCSAIVVCVYGNGHYLSIHPCVHQCIVTPIFHALMHPHSLPRLLSCSLTSLRYQLMAMPSIHRSCNPNFIHSSFMYASLLAFIHSFIHLSIHPCIQNHACMHACIHSFIHPFIHSFIHSLHPVLMQDSRVGPVPDNTGEAAWEGVGGCGPWPPTPSCSRPTQTSDKRSALHTRSPTLGGRCWMTSLIPTPPPANPCRSAPGSSHLPHLPAAVLLLLLLLPLTAHPHVTVTM